MYGGTSWQRVKARPETKDTRILGISGFIDDEEASELANHGFDDYLKKPFTMDEFCERVENLLSSPPSKRFR